MVTDLLLEKMKMEESAAANPPITAPRKIARAASDLIPT
jgi:hypothetical protein